MITDDDVKKLEKKFATKSDLVDFKDAILHEIKGLREDVVIVTGYKDQIEDIDYRVEQVEKFSKIPPITR